ncbi:MAG: DUF2891 domain-containing protein [bacterium]
MKYYFPVILSVVFLLSVLLITELFDGDSDKIQEDKALELITVKERPVLNLDIAEKLAALSLSCILKPYPNKPGHIFTDEASEVTHTTKTPIFSGCFDWHSAVHMHWTLVRLIRLFPDLSQKQQIIELMNSQFTEEKVKAEFAFFSEKQNVVFERTYGWAWLLRLQSELALLGDENGKKWFEALSPLTKLIRNRSIEYFKKLPKPVRDGTHSNTAFSIDQMLNYATILKDREFEEILKEESLRFFSNDINCPTQYEPSGIDFISPCLSEAYLMSQILDQKEFYRWFDKFLKSPENNEFLSILNPPEVTDHSDYLIGHLVGLNFQRAWAFFGISNALSTDDHRKKLFKSTASNHLDEGLSGMDKTGYGGEHWLASFALYALTVEQ